jgi:hypothetical protein
MEKVISPKGPFSISSSYNNNDKNIRNSFLENNNNK